jgi:hypothetical protein
MHNTHQSETLLTICVQDDRQTLQIQDASPWLEHFQQRIKHIQMDFRIDFLGDDLVERKHSIAHYRHQQVLRTKMSSITQEDTDDV